MPIPTYEDLMKPLLEVLADGQPRAVKEVVDRLADRLGLTDEERAALLPSGRQPLFDNRVGWARTYLKKAGLIETPQRGTVRITERGKKVLANKPSKINREFLSQFPEFQQWMEESRPSPGESAQKDFPPVHSGAATPEEQLDEAHRQIRARLVSDLLERIRGLPPRAFEWLVLHVLKAMGYGVADAHGTELTPGSGDEGIDGILWEDRLGLDAIYVQAKQWGSGQPVGRPEIQKFVGALHGKGAKKGVFITSSTFSNDAQTYAEGLRDIKIVLIDGRKLAELMVDYGIGVSVAARYEIKRIDSDFFAELEGEWQ